MSRHEAEVAWRSIKQHIKGLELHTATNMLIAAYFGKTLCRDLIEFALKSDSALNKPSAINKDSALVEGSTTEYLTLPYLSPEQQAAWNCIESRVKELPTVRPHLTNAVLSLAYISDPPLKELIEEFLTMTPKFKAAWKELTEAIGQLFDAPNLAEILRMARVCTNIVEIQKDSLAKDEFAYDHWKMLLVTGYEILRVVYTKAIVPAKGKFDEFGGVVEAIRSLMHDILDEQFDRSAIERLAKEGLREMLIECDDMLPRVPVGETLEYLMD